jgi:hypothetical protein
MANVLEKREKESTATYSSSAAHLTLFSLLQSLLKKKNKKSNIRYRKKYRVFKK